MPTVANGSQVELYYIQEDGSGLIPTPAPDFKPIRFNTDGMTRDTTQIDSNEINPARQRPVSRQGTYSVSAEIVGEASYGSHEDLMMAVLQAAAWDAQVTDTQITFSVDDTDNSVNDSADGFVTAGFLVGQLVNVVGFLTNPTENDFVAGKIISLTTGKMIIGGLQGDTLVTEIAGDSVTIETPGASIDVGSTVPTFAIVERHTDINVDYVYRRCRVATLNIAAPIDSPGLLTFGMVGEEAQEYTFPGDETFTAATATEMMVTTQGGMLEAGLGLDYLTDYNITLSNNMEPLFSLFQRPAYSVQNGIFTVEGSMTAMMPDGTMYAKYLDETPTDHIVTLTEATQSYQIYLPSVIYTQADKAVGGQGPILPSYTMSAGYDGLAATTIRITRIP
jgi:hypothetical protein